MVESPINLPAERASIPSEVHEGRGDERAFLTALGAGIATDAAVTVRFPTERIGYYSGRQLDLSHFRTGKCSFIAYDGPDGTMHVGLQARDREDGAPRAFIVNYLDVTAGKEGVIQLTETGEEQVWEKATNEYSRKLWDQGQPIIAGGIRAPQQPLSRALANRVTEALTTGSINTHLTERVAEILTYPGGIYDAKRIDRTPGPTPKEIE